MNANEDTCDGCCELYEDCYCDEVCDECHGFDCYCDDDDDYDGEDCGGCCREKGCWCDTEELDEENVVETFRPMNAFDRARCIKSKKKNKD